MFARLFILGIVIMAAWTTTANAATWEELYSATSENVEAKVELKKRSLRQRLVRGEKIVSAHLRMFYRQGGQRTSATGDYEIHCAARIVYRSNLNMEAVAADRSTSAVHKSKKEILAGKEYLDFVSLMDILCTR